MITIQSSHTQGTRKHRIPIFLSEIRKKVSYRKYFKICQNLVIKIRKLSHTYKKRKFSKFKAKWMLARTPLLHKINTALVCIPYNRPPDPYDMWTLKNNKPCPKSHNVMCEKREGVTICIHFTYICLNTKSFQKKSHF